jgi:UDP-3-O-[3-hydroxymyristoyl] N-acetylglucosamine deacetylase
VEINAPECPMLDGSAQPFVDAFTKAGFTKQSAPVQTASFAEPITYVEDHAEISYVPSDDFRVTFFADFGDSIVGNQVYHYVAETTDYAAEIAPARTFVFKKEIEALKKANLIKGGSLENALVITAQGYMNGPLRFSTEIVRHKLLDLLGDLMLLGKPLRGHVLANKSGHRSHVAFVQQLRERMSP